MKLKLIKKVDEAKGTKSFFFESDKAVSFDAGQYLYLTLSKLNYPDPKGSTRHFTIASSPTESDFLKFTTRIRMESGYKRTLDELPMGSEVEGEGPNGTFFFDEKETGPDIFLAGGIGITPFRSIIKYVADKNLSNPIYLIYSNSDSDITFKKEFDEIAGSHKNINVGYVITSTEGHLDEEKIGKLTKDWQLDAGKCTWWICGPPPFIDAMETALAKMKVPSGHVRSEKFTGY